MTCITIQDITTKGVITACTVLPLETSTTTLRELIARRIRHTVEKETVWTGMVPWSLPLSQVAEYEQMLNGVKTSKDLEQFIEKECRRACRVFSSNGFFVLINDQQVTDLDQAMELHEHSSVQFVKLVQLVGG